MFIGTSQKEKVALACVLELIPQWPRRESRTLSRVYSILNVFQLGPAALATGASLIIS